MCGLLENFCSPYMKLLLPNQNTYLINENMQVSIVVSGINSHCFMSQNVDRRLAPAVLDIILVSYNYLIPKKNENYYKSDEKLIDPGPRSRSWK